jgi:hypothetical protein
VTTEMVAEDDPTIILGIERQRLYCLVEFEDETTSEANLNRLFETENELLKLVPSSVEGCLLYAQMVWDRADEVPAGLENLILGLLRLAGKSA